MRILIDSDTFLCASGFEAVPRLSSRAKGILEDPFTECVLSMASIWELALKADRLKLDANFEPVLAAAIRNLDLTILEITLRHIIYSTSLPWHHRDPFDRILISQSLLEGLPILTIDRKISRYGAQVVW